MLSHAQLLALGLGPDAIKHRARAGVLFRKHRGVYAVGRPRLTRHGRWMAAVLACGQRAVLFGPSAGALLGLLRADGDETHVAVPGTGGRVSRDGMRVHRVALEPWETAVVDVIPTTTVARTLLDLSAGATPARIARLLDRAERLRVYDDRRVRATLEAHPRAPGAARLRAALAAYQEPAATKNVLEAAMLDLCRTAGLTRPQVNVWVAGHEVDFLWSQQRVIVETDGRETHLTKRAFEADRARDAHHTALGYRVVRFTYRQVLGEPAAVAVILRRLTT